MNQDPRPPDSPELDTDALTGEVGSEGGSPGDLEIEQQPIGEGSEAGQLWHPDPHDTKQRDVRRDEAGEGRRSP